MYCYELCIIVGGDQMTAARTRGCKRIRSNAERGKERLEGFHALIEDWHAKGILLGVRNVLVREHNFTYISL